MWQRRLGIYGHAMKPRLCSRGFIVWLLARDVTPRWMLLLLLEVLPLLGGPGIRISLVGGRHDLVVVGEDRDFGHSVTLVVHGDAAT